MSSQSRGGRPEKLKPENLESLREVAREHPGGTLEELREAFAAWTGEARGGRTDSCLEERVPLDHAP
jgi:transposase